MTTKRYMYDMPDHEWRRLWACHAVVDSRDEVDGAPILRKAVAELEQSRASRLESDAQVGQLRGVRQLALHLAKWFSTHPFS